MGTTVYSSLTRTSKGVQKICFGVSLALDAVTIVPTTARMEEVTVLVLGQHHHSSCNVLSVDGRASFDVVILSTLETTAPVR
jgi:hypothetical protein